MKLNVKKKNNIFDFCVSFFAVKIFFDIRQGVFGFAERFADVAIVVSGSKTIEQSKVERKAFLLHVGNRFKVLFGVVARA